MLTSKYVFLNNGKPVKEVKQSFTAALKRAGIQDFRFHDLRHTFASQVLLRGGALKGIQELLGHKTMTMTLGMHTLHRGIKKRKRSTL